MKLSKLRRQKLSNTSNTQKNTIFHDATPVRIPLGLEPVLLAKNLIPPIMPPE